MTAIKEKDFIEIEYTGTLKEDGSIFDTTDKKVAEDNELASPNGSYGPMVACIGEGFLIKGLNDQLLGKEPGEYTIDISAEDGFGKKDARMIQMLSASKFKQHKIQPVPGLQVNIDGMMATIKTVSGGRCMVDFNHPLAGHDLVYNIKVNKIVDDEKTKVDTFLKYMGLENIDIETKDGVVTVKLQTELDPAMQEEFTKKVKEVIPSIKEVKFVIDKEEKKAQ